MTSIDRTLLRAAGPVLVAPEDRQHPRNNGVGWYGRRHGDVPKGTATRLMIFKLGEGGLFVELYNLFSGAGRRSAKLLHHRGTGGPHSCSGIGDQATLQSVAASHDLCCNSQVEVSVPDIHLSDEQADILREIVEARVLELKREISHTDSPRFRNTLYQVDETLGHVLEQLPRRVPIRD